jgi:uncharacterized protein YeaO (DUF488 family)
MSLRIHIAQAGSTRKAAEGLRIGVARFLPRGVRRSEYARLNYFDVWLPILAPSRDLLSQFKSSKMSVPTFFRRYRTEMEQTEPRQTIILLAKIANRQPITLCCYCEDETRCHRSVLIRLVREAGEK